MQKKFESWAEDIFWISYILFMLVSTSLAAAAVIYALIHIFRMFLEIM